jgi:hypothetical protein
MAALSATTVVTLDQHRHLGRGVEAQQLGLAFPGLDLEQLAGQALLAQHQPDLPGERAERLVIEPDHEASSPVLPRASGALPRSKPRGDGSARPRRPAAPARPVTDGPGLPPTRSVTCVSAGPRPTRSVTCRCAVLTNPICDMPGRAVLTNAICDMRAPGSGQPDRDMRGRRPAGPAWAPAASIRFSRRDRRAAPRRLRHR